MKINDDIARFLLFQKVESNGAPFFKVVLQCKKGALNLFLSISMAYNVISCRKVAENTQIVKIAKFAIEIWLLTSEITKKANKF